MLFHSLDHRGGKEGAIGLHVFEQIIALRNESRRVAVHARKPVADDAVGLLWVLNNVDRPQIEQLLAVIIERETEHSIGKSENQFTAVRLEIGGTGENVALIFAIAGEEIETFPIKAIAALLPLDH